MSDFQNLGLQLVLISIELFSTDRDLLFVWLDTPALVMMRMMLAVMLHFCLVDVCTSSMKKIKFVNNHTHLFEYPLVAVIAMNQSFFFSFFTEFLNIFYLMDTDDALDMLGNFVAL